MPSPHEAPKLRRAASVGDWSSDLEDSEEEMEIDSVWCCRYLDSYIDFKDSRQPYLHPLMQDLTYFRFEEYQADCAGLIDGTPISNHPFPGWELGTFVAKHFNALCSVHRAFKDLGMRTGPWPMFCEFVYNNT